VLVKIDCEKGEGVEIAKEFGIRGYPSYVMVDAARLVTASWIGYDGPASFAARVADGVTDQRTIELKEASFAEAPSALLARTIAHHKAKHYDFAGAAILLRQARDLDSDSEADYAASILFFMFYAAQGGDVTLDEFEIEAKQAAAAADAAASDHLELAMMMSSLARGNDAPERAIPYLKRAMAYPEQDLDEGDLRTRGRLAVDYALLVTGDKNEAVALKKASQPEDWMESAGRLNAFAWWCFENEVNLEEAQVLAMRGVELATDDKQRASILDTAAEICHASGNCDEAVKLIQRAIELDPEQEAFRKQLVRFELARDEADRG